MDYVTFKNFKIRIQNNKFNGHDVCQIFKRVMQNSELFFEKDKLINLLKKYKLIDEELFTFLENHFEETNFYIFDIDNLSFDDSKFTVILDEKNEPWFYGNEVALLLGYSTPNRSLTQHVKQKYQKQLHEINPLQNTGGQKDTIFINEHGLYQLIMKSKLPLAESFQDWVYEEVLPSIRKHGEYKLKEELENMKKEIESQKIFSQNN